MAWLRPKRNRRFWGPRVCFGCAALCQLYPGIATQKNAGKRPNRTSNVKRNNPQILHFKKILVSLTSKTNKKNLIQRSPNIHPSDIPPCPQPSTTLTASMRVRSATESRVSPSG